MSSLDNVTRDPFFERVLLGMAEARQAAVEKARQTGTLLVFWRDGKVVQMTAEEYDKLRETPQPE